MLEALVSLFAPHECVGCGRQGSLYCSDCMQRAPALSERCYRCRSLSPDDRTCPKCRTSSALHTVQAATEYSESAKQLLWRLKFSGGRAAVGPMAQLMRERQIFEENTLFVFVPTATSRVRQRGYDQAALLCRELSRLTGLSSVRLLARHGQTRQVGTGRAARIRHLEGAFRVRLPERVVGAHIVLVDDVLTTGATLEAAARLLRQAGARRVDAVVFAQA